MSKYYDCWVLVPADDSEPFTGDIKPDGTTGGWRALAFRSRKEARAAKAEQAFPCKVKPGTLRVFP